MRSRRRAVALVLALAVLAVLSMLATTLVQTTGVERRASRSHADRVRALMLAEAGVERAVGHLRGALEAGVVDWLSGDAADAALGALSSPSLKAGAAHGHAFSGLLGGDLSAPTTGGGVRPMAGTYVTSGDQYALRISDSATRLDLALREGGGEGELRVLGNLCRLLGIDEVTSEAAIDALASSDRLVDRADLLARLGGAGAALAPYVTVHAWRDATAVRPTPRGDELERPALERVVGGRAPIQLNQAPELLLRAVFEGLAARYLDTRDGSVVTVELSAARAEALAEAVVTRRSAAPFDGLEAFEAWLAAQVGGLLTADEATLVAVAADPDARLLKLNPDAALFGDALVRRFDRSDLTQWTVELTTAPTGMFRVESLGRVLGRGGRVAARAEVDTVLRLATTRRIATQAGWRDAAGVIAGVRSYPEADPSSASEAAGKLGLGRATQLGASAGAEWFAPTSFSPIGDEGTLSSGNALTGSATGGADRYADGFHAPRSAARYLAYDAGAVGVDEGGLSFHWKPDWDASGKTTALLYVDQPLGEGRGLSTVVYQRAGQLFASRPWYRAYRGKPAHYSYASYAPVTIVGKVRADAAASLEAIGSQWLKDHRPGLAHYYYPAYGRQFRIWVFEAIGKGLTDEVIYFYDFEKIYGYAHIGCVAHALHLPDYYGVIFESGYEAREKSVDTTSFIDVVDESGNNAYEDHHHRHVVYAASRVERAVDIGAGLDPHRWHHVQLTWTDGTDLRLFLDGVESRDHARWYGPLTPWSSRLQAPDGRLYPGPIRLDRASGEAGTMTPELTGSLLYLGNHGTLEGLALRASGEPVAPEPRYVASGAWTGSADPPPGARLVAVQARTVVPAGCGVWVDVRAADATWRALPASGVVVGPATALRVRLARDDDGDRTPFVHSLRLSFAHPPRVVARHVR